MLETDLVPRHGWQSCTLGQTKESNINFDLASLKSYLLSGWRDILYDCMVVAASAEYCDRSYRRPGHGWGRIFNLEIPVHDARKWRSPEISQSLQLMLTYLTGDQCHFQFVDRIVQACEPLQGNFIAEQIPAPTLAYSNGMDSRMVSALLSQQENEIIRVRLGKREAELDKTKDAIPFIAIPYSVKPGGTNLEVSFRTRGFKHALISGLAAHLVNSKRVIMPESGQGCFGPALIITGHAYPDFRNFPVFISYMERFLNLILEDSIRFEYPRLWSTKGETLKDYLQLKSIGWADTRSCWQSSRYAGADGKKRQCGICAACLLRRMSVHAAGQDESAEVYIWSDLSASTFEQGARSNFKRKLRVHREYAIAGVQLWQQFAEFPRAKVYHHRSKMMGIQLSQVLRTSSQEIETRLENLLSNHEEEWVAFVESLGKKSFIREWITRHDSGN